MDLFTPIVDNSKLHQNFVSILLPYRKAERDLLLSWAEGFVDRDGKIIKEFQTTFNSSFWEIYLHGLFNEYYFKIDWCYETPDFSIRAGNNEFIVEATTANAAQGKPNEWDKKLGSEEIKNIKFYELNREAIIRLSNSIYSKLKKYKNEYSKLPHVRNKPFVIAVAPFEQPYFNLQYDRPIRALLYDYYVDEDEYLRNPSAFPFGPEAKQLGYIEKDNGAEIYLGFFNDSTMKEVSAILFSCTATWGKLSAMADNQEAQKTIQTLWATAPDGKPIIGDSSRPEHQENIFDGLQIYHNPYASIPLSPEIFRRPRVVQHYLDKKSGEWVCEGRCDSLLYRQAFSTPI
jgi:hypothetical protein